jgi:DNA-binding NarL/FixJ family response regulator
MFGIGKKSDGSGPLVLLVGHCGFDSGGLERAVRSAAPDARVEGVNSRKALDAKLDDASLLLINRQLDGSFGVPMGDHGDGVELIRELAASENAPPCVLISNFDDAQKAAEEAGALPGFGKKDVRAESAARSIRSGLEAQNTEPS